MCDCAYGQSFIYMSAGSQPTGSLLEVVLRVHTKVRLIADPLGGLESMPDYVVPAEPYNAYIEVYT
jgi:hypothetical protein